MGLRLPTSKWLQHCRAIMKMQKINKACRIQMELPRWVHGTRFGRDVSVEETRWLSLDARSLLSQTLIARLTLHCNQPTKALLFWKLVQTMSANAGILHFVIQTCG